MRFRKRVGVILLLSISLIFSMAQTGSAATTYKEPMVNWMNISITHAYYYDMDGDGQKDDILVEYTCRVKDWIPTPSWSYFELYLELPSGLTYLVSFEVIGRYRTLGLGLIWYNCASQSGWYNIQVDSYTVFSNCIGYSTSNYDFDPPTGTPGGPPHAIVYLL